MGTDTETGAKLLTIEIEWGLLPRDGLGEDAAQLGALRLRNSQEPACFVVRYG